MGTWTEFKVTVAFPLLVTFKIGIEVTFGVCTVIGTGFDVEFIGIIGTVTYIATGAGIGVGVVVDYTDLIVVYVFSLIDVCCMDDEVEF